MNQSCKPIGNPMLGPTPMGKSQSVAPTRLPSRVGCSSNSAQVGYVPALFIGGRDRVGRVRRQRRALKPVTHLGATKSRQLSTTDISAPTTMKNAAKCDT